MKQYNAFHAAGRIWGKLTDAAASNRILFYGDIAPLIPTIPLDTGRALGPIQTLCIDKGLPPLTAIVTRKDTKAPGQGFMGSSAEDLQDSILNVHRFDWSQVPNPFRDFGKEDTEEAIAEALIADPDAAETVYRRMPSRGIAQQVFRTALLLAYDNSCAMCGVSFTEALEAAHIVPWSKATPRQKIDPRNGVLLCANHHRIFEKWFRIGADYRISYVDLDKKYEPYSRADDALSIDLDGQKLTLPEDRRLWPVFPSETPKA